MANVEIKSNNPLINDFAIRSFRTTADRDYIHARLAYQAQLVPQFLWSSLHSLEKYSKCILLLNRIRGKKIKHEITPALELIADQGKFEVQLSEKSVSFIKDLESGARFRYFEVSWSSDHRELVRLDRAVWELRRYCQSLDFFLKTDKGEINVLKANLKKISGLETPTLNNTHLNSGFLEAVLNKRSHPSRPGLIWKNLFYSSSNRKSVQIKTFFYAENSPLSLHPEILEEVLEYIYLPKDIQNHYNSSGKS
jgi:hypothetical protein